MTAWRQTNWLRILWCKLFHASDVVEQTYRFGVETGCAKCGLYNYQDCVWM